MGALIPCGFTSQNEITYYYEFIRSPLKTPLIYSETDCDDHETSQVYDNNEIIIYSIAVNFFNLLTGFLFKLVRI